jgi:superfamily I DNA and/or RNA helicase
MDSASKIPETLALGPIMWAEKLIMLGDCKPCIFYLKKDEVKVPLFDRLCEKYP